MADTAGHQLHKGSEKEKRRNDDFSALEAAKNKEAELRKTKPMKYVWDKFHKAYFLTPQ